MRRLLARWAIVRRPALAAIEVLKWAKFRLRQRSFRPHQIERTVLGEPMSLRIADTDGRDWYERSSYMSEDWPELRFMRDHMIRAGDVVIDCGAHQGITAILFSRWVGPSGRVIAIDPVPNNLEIAAINLRNNAITNVELIDSAVGGAHGWTRLGGGTNVQIGTALFGHRTRVMTLDDLVSARPTVLKMDIEGAEAEAFAGGHAFLDLGPRIALEVHAEALAKLGRRVDEVLAPLADRGYRLWVQWEEHEEPRPLRPEEQITHRAHIFAFPLGTEPSRAENITGDTTR